MKLSDFDYELPPALIAQYPAAERSASRLLHLDGNNGELADRRFRDLPDLVKAGDLLVMNDTRVIKARLTGRKDSGGQVEVLVQNRGTETLINTAVRISTPSGVINSNITSLAVGGVQALRVPISQPAAASIRFESKVNLSGGRQDAKPSNDLCVETYVPASTK